ncbi:MAG: hypothetical protein AVDCRST_MAG68-4784 [uncultured Gemmatimonadetes bacterium]|uniref:Uncharacterized protein n=1 Tax=uncultured Gemmatimonadota bacterium TaxID=203437 RepID=A0A6J4MJ88_9BACT|nr:MAG: hypothetical protein AVDCRST_MAG68-4784 [uncultured Gemmatimonadota bacterium]
MMRTVHLPPHLYLPARPASGGEPRDVPPWDGARDYVTDGARYGVRFESGAVMWFPGSDRFRVEELRADFAGADLDALVDGLRRYVADDERLRALWAGDLAALDRLRVEVAAHAAGEA